jgi:hypothetical protein
LLTRPAKKDVLYQQAIYGLSRLDQLSMPFATEVDQSRNSARRSA